LLAEVLPTRRVSNPSDQQLTCHSQNHTRVRNQHSISSSFRQEAGQLTWNQSEAKTELECGSGSQDQAATRQPGSVNYKRIQVMTHAKLRIQNKLDKYFSTCTRKHTMEASKSLLGAHTNRTRLQLRRAPRLLTTRLHGLYINLVVRREYLSPGHSGSTSTTLYAAATSSSGRMTTSTTHFNKKTSRGRLPRHQQLVGSTSN
jgi:hypothetical protein